MLTMQRTLGVCPRTPAERLTGRRFWGTSESMKNHARSFVLGFGILALSAGGALADTNPAKPAPAPAPATVPAPAKVAPATTPEPVANAKDAGGAPAAGATRESLLDDLKKANALLATDKKAAAEAAKGKDKDAAKAAKDKVKADGKAINEINMKLHALKPLKTAKPLPPPAAAKPGATPPA